MVPAKTHLYIYEKFIFTVIAINKLNALHDSLNKYKYLNILVIFYGYFNSIVVRAVDTNYSILYDVNVCCF